MQGNVKKKQKNIDNDSERMDKSMKVHINVGVKPDLGNHGLDNFRIQDKPD